MKKRLNESCIEFGRVVFELIDILYSLKLTKNTLLDPLKNKMFKEISNVLLENKRKVSELNDEFPTYQTIELLKQFYLNVREGKIRSKEIQKEVLKVMFGDRYPEEKLELLIAESQKIKENEGPSKFASINIAVLENGKFGGKKYKKFNSTAKNMTIFQTVLNPFSRLTLEGRKCYHISFIQDYFGCSKEKAERAWKILTEKEVIHIKSKEREISKRTKIKKAKNPL